MQKDVMNQANMDLKFQHLRVHDSVLGLEDPLMDQEFASVVQTHTPQKTPPVSVSITDLILVTYSAVKLADYSVQTLYCNPN